MLSNQVKRFWVVVVLFCSFPLVTPSTGSSLALVEQLCVKGLDVLEKLVRPTSDGSTSLK